MTMIKLAVLMLMSFAMFGTASAQINAPASEPSRPNIVLILADDLGYSDIGPFGSEINTPNLSALAENGIRFSNYHTAASCAPSRSMLLTGVDSHRAGVPNIPEAIPPEQITQTNYQGVLSKNVVTVATLLEDQGYHTVMAGKWHLGMEPDQLPSSRGFKRTITMADTGADNWEQRPYLPIYKKANWFADGKETTLPDDFYSSELLVDKTIEFIEEKQDKQPFFAYIPFQAVHIPVQSPKHFTDKYLDTYSDGWDALRKQRQSKAVALGHVPADSQMVKMQSTADWQSLDEEEKRYQSKRMAVYAGMVEAMDHHIGRLVEQLKQSGQYENTVFIFTSDNGAEYNGWNNQRKLTNRLLQWYMGYNLDLDNLGLKGSFNAIGPSFASAAASPLSFYKFYSGEGGLRVPLIIAGDPIAANNAHSRAFTFVTDITPTILELSNITRHESRYGGRTIEPIIGKSLIPLLNGNAERVYNESDTVAYEIGGNAALFQDDYKIMKNRGPMGGDQWQLFNIALDPGETVNLAEDMPERFESMLGLYDDYVQKNGVLPVSAEYVQIVQVFINGFRDVQGMRLLVLVLSGLVVMLVVLTAYSVRVKNRT